MLFSERIGYKSTKTILVEEINTDIINGLWNCIITRIEVPNENSVFFNYDYRNLEIILYSLWSDFFKFPLDTIESPWDSYNEFRNLYFDKSNHWHFYYDLIEFIADTIKENENDFRVYPDMPHFTYDCNRILEREMSGYRFVNGIISPITSEIELRSIDESLRISDKYHGVREHIKQALSLLSDREKPDYRNSIKESISAVESLVKVIAMDSNGGLKNALSLMEKQGVVFHGSLKEAFLKLYGYTSDEDGIRHAIFNDLPNLTFDDAKYMLVTCSGFCNYIISKTS